MVLLYKITFTPTTPMTNIITEVPEIEMAVKDHIVLVPGNYYGSGPLARRIDKLEEHDNEGFLHGHVHFSWRGLDSDYTQKGFCTTDGFRKWLQGLAGGRNQEQEDRWNCLPQTTENTDD